MVSETVKTAALVAGLGGSILGLAWRGGSKLSQLEANASAMSAFKAAQEERNKDQDGRNEITTAKLSRIETMLELMMRSDGLTPPPKK